LFFLALRKKEQLIKKHKLIRILSFLWISKKLIEMAETTTETLIDVPLLNPTLEKLGIDKTKNWRQQVRELR